eukprot:TRINITY_DN3878_c0_g1_i1.p1 TRINITY_DN3878_c0_g1~~TRINITY_DN3878_c0_g1_i1.p1  ORF type:complete len:636 (+),score=180.83 TRINITY_DN3878_c0_g1_i1:81-1988(+)
MPVGGVDKKFSGLVKNEGQAIELKDGTRLAPGSRVHMMYCNLAGRMDPEELKTEDDIYNMHSSLTSSINLFAINRGRKLSTEWVLTFDHIGHQRDVTPHDLDSNLLELGSFDTVESFMRIWNHIPVQEIEAAGSLRLFRKNITPMAEDDFNNGGGRWCTKAPAQDRAALWLNLALSVLKESLDGVTVNGCAMHANGLKQGTDILQLWVHGAAPGTEVHARSLANELTFDLKRPCLLNFSYTVNVPKMTGHMALSVVSGPSERGSSYRGSDIGSGGLGSGNGMGSGGGMPSLMSAPSTPGTGSSSIYQHNPYTLHQQMANSGGSHAYPKPPGGLSGWGSEPAYNYGQGHYSPRSNSMEWAPPHGDEHFPGVPISHGHHGPASGSPIITSSDQMKGPQVEGVLRQVTANLLGYSHQAPVLPRSQMWPGGAEDDSMQDYQQQPEGAKKKKRNKPDKHQRERLRRKKAKQAAIEQAMMEMAGTKCCECELYLACVKCTECPSDRLQFCQECFGLIHKVGKRQNHTQFIMFENPGEPPEGGGAATGSSGRCSPRSTPLPQPSSEPEERDDKEQYPFLEYFEPFAKDFTEFITNELDDLSELKGFTDIDTQRVTDDFFSNVHISAAKRGRATRELLYWINS